MPLHTVHPHEVCSKPLKLQANKAMGPDNIPSRILNEFAYELAEPVTSIFNTSLSSGLVPIWWKFPASYPFRKRNKLRLRPIPAAPHRTYHCVIENFVVSCMVEDIGGQIDNCHHGSLRETSTTFCLLDLINNWLSKNGQPTSLS